MIRESSSTMPLYPIRGQWLPYRELDVVNTTFLPLPFALSDETISSYIYSTGHCFIAECFGWKVMLKIRPGTTWTSVSTKKGPDFEVLSRNFFNYKTGVRIFKNFFRCLPNNEKNSLPGGFLPISAVPTFPKWQSLKTKWVWSWL